MEIVTGSVVISRAGRDKGSLLAVTGFLEGRVLVCDGGERPLERPKPKNLKHIAVTSRILSEYDMAANSRIRRALGNIAAHSEGQSGEAG